ncbi:hypothetical protein AWZ03_014873, partial [Drosophila navojoa]
RPLDDFAPDNTGSEMENPQWELLMKWFMQPELRKEKMHTRA